MKKKPRILIVDDDQNDIDSLVALLQDDYTATIAINTKQAINAVQQKSPPDLILLDIAIPITDGYAICHGLTNDQDTKNIPIILLIAGDNGETAIKGLQAGAADFIVKPFHAVIVHTRIRIHLALKRKTELLGKFTVIDGFTEIPNRRALDETLAREWLRATRTGEPLSLIMISIDHFNEYIENYGNAAGGECLLRVARALAGVAMRAADFVANCEREMFVAVLPNVKRKHAEDMGNKFWSAIETLRIPHAYSTVSPNISVSVGVSSGKPSQKFTGDALAEIAEKMVKQAKAKGGNQVCNVHLNEWSVLKALNDIPE